MKKIYLLMMVLAIVIKSQTVFPVGGFIGHPEHRDSQAIYDSITALGFNTVVQYANPNNRTYLENFNLFAHNEDNANEKISYYARGYLKKWEAEENNLNTLSTGIHHKYGTTATYLGRSCWKATGSSARDSLVYGPSYRQDKRYRLEYMKSHPLNYKVKFILGLAPLELEEDVPICRLSVIYRYREILNGTITEKADTFAVKEVMASQLSFNTFNEITLNYSYPAQYTDKLYSQIQNMNGPVTNPPVYDDEYPGMGITFQVDWFGIGEFYVDYIQVYDQVIGVKFVNSIDTVTNEINTYNDSFPTSTWTNLTRWYAADEPQTIDQFEPMRLVDSILRGASDRGLITTLMPTWDGERNGDRTIPKFVQFVNPQPLMIDFYPYWVNKTNEFGLELLRNRLVEADSSQKDFWYVGQGFGELDSATRTTYLHWRKPSPSELNASVMLALAHGIKGLMFWNYWSYDSRQPNIGQPDFLMRLLMNTVF